MEAVSEAMAVRRTALRLLVLSIVAIALSGCAATNAFHPGSTSSTGTVLGHVVIHACSGPLAANECPARPAPGVVITFKGAATGRVVTAKTDPTGAYSATLPAGTYSILVGGRIPGTGLSSLGQSPCPPGIVANPVGCWPSKFVPPIVGPAHITVVAGHSITADFSITFPMSA